MNYKNWDRNGTQIHNLFAWKDKIERNQTLTPKLLRIYDKFTWKDKIDLNQNFNIKNIKDFRPKHKIKSTGIELNLY